jgi:predicted nucleic acid-binding protein
VVVPVGPEHLHHALDLAARYRLSLWDGLVVATAAAAGCGVLLTEDLQTGRVLDGVSVENPFAGLAGGSDR